MVYASTVDLEEAYYVGQKAALLAAAGEHGYMATILRDRLGQLQRRIRQSPAGRSRRDRTASSPRTGSPTDGTDVTDEFLNYARPLIGDDWVSVPDDRRPPAARAAASRIFADQKLDEVRPAGGPNGVRLVQSNAQNREEIRRRRSSTHVGHRPNRRPEPITAVRSKSCAA